MPRRERFTSQSRPNLSAKSGRPARPPASLALLNIELARGRGRDRLYRQIVEFTRRAILAGEIGGRLPPTREMAAALGVNRATVARAYQELEADGLVESGGARGTVVMARAPETEATGVGDAAAPAWVAVLPPLQNGGLSADPTLIRDITASGGRDEVVSFAAAVPGPELIPSQRIAAAIDRGLARSGPRMLGYGSIDGLEDLREALAQTVGQPLLNAGDGLMVVSGATQGIALAARVLTEPGDEVAVEAPTYFGLLQTLALAGARVIGIPVDRHGMRTDQLEAVLGRRRIRLIVVQSRFQNPTGAVMSSERRAQLLLVARRHGIPVLEDDIYGMLDLDGAAPAPLKADDRAGSVVYISSFSKSVSPGLRVGWVVAPEAVIDRMVIAKQFADMTSNTVGQVVIADLLASGDYLAHLRWLTGELRTRRSALVSALSSLAGRVEVTSIPGGGASLWCRLGPGLDSRAVAAAAIRRLVAVTPGEAFYPASSGPAERGRDRIRLSFASVSPERMRAGVDRLRQALETLPAFASPHGPTTGVLV